MAIQAGKDAAFRIDNSAGVLFNLTTYLTEIGFPQEPEQLDTTTLGAQEKSFVSGFIGAGLSLSGRFDPAVDGSYDVLATGVAASGAVGKERTFEFYPMGYVTPAFTADATHPRYTGELVILSFEVTTGAADIVGFSCNCRVVGAVTRAVAGTVA